VVLAGWSVWASFDPPDPVKLGLLLSSLWLLAAGIIMQIWPGRPARAD
jgi:phosphatidylcholine synthase